MTATTVAETGVPSLSRDGTPVCLDPAMSSDALDALEFVRALDVIAEYAAGPLGAAALRARRPTDDASWIRQELGLVDEVLAALRRGGRIDVAPVPDVRAAIGRLDRSGSVLELVELAAVRDTLSAGRDVLRELDHHAESCPRIADLRVEPTPRPVARMLELAIGDGDELLDSASPGLASARREVHTARDRLIRRLEAVMHSADASVVPAGATVTMRDGRYVIPVRRDSRQRPEGIIHDESANAGTLFVEPTAAIELGNALRSAVIAEERETLLVLRELTEKLRPVRHGVAALHGMCIAIDTIVARARWANELGSDVPAIGEVGGPLVMNAARHPLLLARGIKVVPFDLMLVQGERTLLISGPNTGGKTVLLKTVGLALALAQSGFIPPVGPQSVLPIVRRIFVDIGDHQSLAADLSTFSAHVLTLRTVLDSADRAAIVLLDEIGAGTDPAEGGALATAVLETLTARGALTLATTHLGALKTLATEARGVVNGSLEFDAATLSPTYRFTKGIPGRSYGLAIARRLGVDDQVLAAAEARVPDAEREFDRLLAAVELRRQKLDREEAVLRDRVAGIERREAVVTATAELQRVRESELRQQERHAERDRARQAKAYLLEARKRAEQALGLARGAADEASAKEARRLVEEGIRAEADRLEEPTAGTTASGQHFQAGQSVRLNTGATGDVVEVRGDGKAVVLVGAMRLVIATSTLTAAPPRAASPHQRSPVTAIDEPARTAAHEIDLRGMRADEAEAMVHSAIDAAVLAELPRLAIIHGMGTGVLRDTVRQLLASDARVASFDFAPRRQGGIGVTVAVLR